MKQKELFAKGLPKWPALLVVGETVTKEQAWEILIKTARLTYLSTNNHKMRHKIYEYIFKVKLDASKHYHSVYDVFNYDHVKYNEEIAKLEKFGYIGDKLEYLHNDRILSSWIGGPHGWCDWNGRIFCNNFNIGKYPDVETVFNEWKIIAKAFPYLNLKCQLFDGESCEDNISPVVEYVVKNGKVKIQLPTNIESKIREDDALSTAYNLMYNPNREMGCTFEQFKEAYDYVSNGCKYSENDQEELNR